MRGRRCRLALSSKDKGEVEKQVRPLRALFFY